MATFIDYYKTLGITKEADEKAIKKAFRKLARKHHPDLNEGDAAAEQKFKAINEANAVLSDKDKRKKYDKYGKDWEHADAYEAAGGRGRGNPFGGGQGYTYSGGGGDYSDFFSQMFDGQGGGNPFGGGGFGGGGRRRTFKGQDLEANLRVNFTDILEDTKQVITVGGKQLRITIPAGVEDGQKLRLRGQGGAGPNGGQAGDLYLTFQVATPAEYRREGADLYKTVDVPLTTMVLGGKVEVTTPSGTVNIPIAELSQPGKRMRLKGKGLPIYKKEESGHLYLDLQAQLPTTLTDEERAAFEQLKELEQS
ncbi:DnaJ C-terminal domain-containing protein [Neolewinella antarctica]|uniref:Curved DNA-binding protein n=1 Tax=Neolewinella antarctica TaxID=442734 RepID=A0ABX0XBZ1_9BACT|nr:DnaJ C-terminal domain-containing protein [Neolewinella antarctica]NJC26786.1 curved DNA-binding protein [Neolewinella antarctica]